MIYSPSTVSSLNKSRNELKKEATLDSRFKFSGERATRLDELKPVVTEVCLVGICAINYEHFSKGESRVTV